MNQSSDCFRPTEEDYNRIKENYLSWIFFSGILSFFSTVCVVYCHNLDFWRRQSYNSDFTSKSSDIILKILRLIQIFVFHVAQVLFCNDLLVSGHLL